MTAAVEPKVVAAPLEPFRGLQPYRCQDRPIFFERTGDGRRLLQAVTIYRGVLFYGESGLGKSSLVNARLVPDALDAGFFPERVLVRPEEGREIVVEAFSCGDLVADGGQRSVFVPDGEASVVLSLEAFEERLHGLTEDEWPLLIFDQFEEIVTLFAEAELHQRSAAPQIQKRIVDLAIRLLSDETLPVKQLFVFREDYLAKIHRLFAAYPELRGQSVRLERIPLESAHRIIRGPFEAFPGAFDPEISPALADRIVASLEQFARTRRQENQFNLSDLQIVCQRLWISKEPEALFERRGAEGLVKDYFEETLDRLPLDLREPAIALLTRMVTSSGTRNVISESDLLGEGEDTRGISGEQLTRALMALRNERGLVQFETRDNVTYYQIVSEFVIGWISGKKEARRIEAVRRRARRHLWYAAAAGAVLALLLGVALLSWFGAEQAQDEAETAKQTAVTAREEADTQRAEVERTDRSRKLAAQAQRHIPDHLDTALLLGVAASDQTGGETTVEAKSGLLTALTTSPSLRRFLPGTAGESTRVALGPDGATAAIVACAVIDAIGCSGVDVHLRDPATDAPLPGFQPARLPDVAAIAFSPDGSRLAALSRDGLTIWDIAGGAATTVQPFARIEGCADATPASLAVAPAAASVVVGASGACLVVWDAASGAVRRLAGRHNGTVTSVAIADDGQTVVSGDERGRVLRWDLTAQPPRPNTVAEHGLEIKGIALAAGGASVTSVDRSGRIIRRVEEEVAGAPVAQPPLPIEPCCVAFDAGGGLLAMGGGDGIVILWDADSGQELDRLTGHDGAVTRLAVSGDGSAVLSVDKSGRIILWDIARRHALERRIAALADGATGVALDADGERLAVAARSGLTLLDVATGAPAGAPVDGASGPVYSVAFGPRAAAALLATGGDGRAEIRDLASGRRVDLPTNDGGQILSVAFNHDGTKLAMGTSAGATEIWDVPAALAAAETAPVRLPTRPNVQINSVAFSGDGGLLAAAGADGMIVVWSVAEGSGLELQGSSTRGVVKSLAFGPDNALLAAGGTDGTITLWEVAGVETRETAEPLLTAHEGLVLGLAFSGDGELLASAGQDGHVLLWDVANRMPLEPALADRADVGWSLAFGASAGGDLLAAAGTDGTVVVWDVDLESWRSRACRTAGRPLTEAEAAQYEIDPASVAVCTGSPPAGVATPAPTRAGAITPDVHRAGA